MTWKELNFQIARCKHFFNSNYDESKYNFICVFYKEKSEVEIFKLEELKKKIVDYSFRKKVAGIRPVKPSYIRYFLSGGEK